MSYDPIWRHTEVTELQSFKKMFLDYKDSQETHPILVNRFFRSFQNISEKQENVILYKRYYLAIYEIYDIIGNER